MHKTCQTCVPQKLVLKVISGSTREHENCNPKTLNLLPLYCLQEFLLSNYVLIIFFCLFLEKNWKMVVFISLIVWRFIVRAGNKTSKITIVDDNNNVRRRSTVLKMLYVAMREACMCDMEGLVVGHCDPEQVPDRAWWGVDGVLLVPPLHHSASYFHPSTACSPASKFCSKGRKVEFWAEETLGWLADDLFVAEQTFSCAYADFIGSSCTAKVGYIGTASYNECWCHLKGVFTHVKTMVKYCEEGNSCSKPSLFPFVMLQQKFQHLVHPITINIHALQTIEVK